MDYDMFRQLLIAQFQHSYLQEVTCRSKSIMEKVVDKSIVLDICR